MILEWQEVDLSKGEFKIIEHHAKLGPFAFAVKRLSPGQKFSKHRLEITLQAGVLKAKQPPVKIYAKEYSKCAHAKRAGEGVLESILFDTQNAIEKLAGKLTYLCGSE